MSTTRNPDTRDTTQTSLTDTEEVLREIKLAILDNERDAMNGGIHPRIIKTRLGVSRKRVTAAIKELEEQGDIEEVAGYSVDNKSVRSSYLPSNHPDTDPGGDK